MIGGEKNLTVKGTWPGLRLDGAELSGLVSRKRSLLTGRVTVTATVQISAKKQPLDLAVITENLVSNLKTYIPRTRFEGVDAADNLRGAEQGKPGRGMEEELFYAAGAVIQTVTQAGSQAALESASMGDAPERNPFSDGAPGLGALDADASANQSGGGGRLWYSITTKFDHSDGKTISYRCVDHASSDIRRYLARVTPRVLARFIPLRLDTVRIGFDLFGTRSFGSSLLGAGPVVVASVRISLKPDAVQLLLEEQFAAGEVGVPLASRGIPNAISAALSSAAVIDGLDAYCSNLCAEK
jgi:hypothetical protein